MGFIRLSKDLLFIEPLNDTVAITGHPHRAYRRRRSAEDTPAGGNADNHCELVPGNFHSLDMCHEPFDISYLIIGPTKITSLHCWAKKRKVSTFIDG